MIEKDYDIQFRVGEFYYVIDILNMRSRIFECIDRIKRARFYSLRFREVGTGAEYNRTVRLHRVDSTGDDDKWYESVQIREVCNTSLSDTHPLILYAVNRAERIEGDEFRVAYSVSKHIKAESDIQ